MKTRRTVRASLVVGAVAAVTVACSSSSSPVTPEVEDGQFTATVSGAVSAQLTGAAESLGTATSPAGWAVQMVAADGSGGVSFTEEGMPRPAPGIYVVASALEHGGNAPNNEFTGIVGVASPASSFGSISGTLTITASSPTRVSGEFSFTAEDPQDQSRTVTVTGSFTAINQDF